MRLYLAYGSNMCRIQMAGRCPRARLVERAEVAGWRFIINRRGVATIIPDPDARIHGLVWALTASDERTLDLYEGVDLGYYHKHSLDLECGTALVYLAADDQPGRPRRDYLEGIVSAATIECLPPPYVAELARWGRPGAR